MGCIQTEGYIGETFTICAKVNSYKLIFCQNTITITLANKKFKLILINLSICKIKSTTVNTNSIFVSTV